MNSLLGRTESVRGVVCSRLLPFCEASCRIEGQSANTIAEMAVAHGLQGEVNRGSASRKQAVGQALTGNATHILSSSLSAGQRGLFYLSASPAARRIVFGDFWRANKLRQQPYQNGFQVSHRLHLANIAPSAAIA